MASFTTELELSDGRPGILTRVVNAMMRGAEASAQARRVQIRTLEAKSDAELAQMGLRREDIAHYIFRDLYYA